MSKRDKAKAARKALKDAMQKDKSMTPDAIAARIGRDARLVADFIAGENDSLDVAAAVAESYAVTLPEIDVADFRAAGYLPEAITNFIALLGWNPGMKLPDGKDMEKFDNNFLAANFSIDRIGKTSARFDRAKLLSFNADAIGALPDEEFAARWREWCASYEPTIVSRVADETKWLMLATAIKARAKTLRDGVKSCAFLARADDAADFDKAGVDKNLLANDRAGLRLLSEFRQRLGDVHPFDPATIHAAIESFAKENGFVSEKGVNVGPVAQPVRVAVAGVPVTPPLGETLAVLGKESVLRRIDTCIRTVEAK
jgi:glutamyl-tRNA synthetase